MHGALIMKPFPTLIDLVIVQKKKKKKNVVMKM